MSYDDGCNIVQPFGLNGGCLDRYRIWVGYALYKDVDGICVALDMDAVMICSFSERLGRHSFSA